MTTELTAVQTGQNRSPAGLESALSYLPNCSADPLTNQVKVEGDGSESRFYVVRGDGVEVDLALLPTQDVLENFKTLASWGLCKMDGVPVPLAKPGDAIASVGQRITLTPVMTPPPPPLPVWPMVAIAVAAIPTLIGFVLYFKKQETYGQ